MNQVKHTFVRASQAGFGQFLNLQSVLEEVATKKLVFFGETHSEKSIIALQTEIQQAMIKSLSAQKLHVIMEHFSFEMQDLL